MDIVGKIIRVVVMKCNKKWYKNICYLVMILMCVLLCAGCNVENKITVEEFNDLKDEITYGCGMNQIELENEMGMFVKKLYAPDSESDIAEAVNLIHKYMTSEERASLTVGEYREGIDTKITKLDIRYYDGNGVDRDKVLLQFVVSYDGDRVGWVVEFVLDEAGKIYKHVLWKEYEILGVIG